MRPIRVLEQRCLAIYVTADPGTLAVANRRMGFPASSYPLAGVTGRTLWQHSGVMKFMLERRKMNHDRTELIETSGEFSGGAETVLGLG